VFWKMVYGKIFRKPFSLFYTAIFRSIYVDFLLTSVLQRLKLLKMLKTFYGKRFTSKQTEPKLNSPFQPSSNDLSLALSASAVKIFHFVQPLRFLNFSYHLQLFFLIIINRLPISLPSHHP
jgi:hypothetical protein